jgi:GT2 family glycosyltransferase
MSECIKTQVAAGGFYEGVKRGYERGYDWLWLMDDDTIATTEALNRLLEKIYIRKNIILGSLVVKYYGRMGNHIL